MACACKVNQEIDRIHKYYSYHGKESNESRNRMSINKKDAARTLLIYILLLPLTPIIFLFVVGFTLFSDTKMLSMRKFFNFIHTVRNGKQQQII